MRFYIQALTGLNKVGCLLVLEVMVQSITRSTSRSTPLTFLPIANIRSGIRARTTGASKWTTFETFVLHSSSSQVSESSLIQSILRSAILAFQRPSSLPSFKGTN